MSLLIKYATRSRVPWFCRAIKNITDTIETSDYQILVSADLDDTIMNHDYVARFLLAYPKVKLVYGYSKSKVDAINRDMDKADPWNLLINFSDDMVFNVNGWDQIMMKAHAERWPNGEPFFAHWNDGVVGDKLPTMSIMNKAYYDIDGYIYYPEYKSFSCDAEAFFVARARGMHHYFEQELFKHVHSSSVGLPYDELYHLNSLHTPHDTKLYWERLHADFGLKVENPEWQIHKKY